MTKATQKKPAAKKAAAKTVAPKTATPKTVAPRKKTAEVKPARVVGKAAPAKGSALDGYVDALDPWQQAVVRPFTMLVAKAAPEAQAYVKWGHPVWDHAGPFALVKPAKAHVTIGLWRGGQLKDAEGVLEGDGDGMRYVRVKSGESLPTSLPELVREAVTLNEKLGDPTKR